MNFLANPRLAPLESCVESDPVRTRFPPPGLAYSVELPQSWAEWRGFEMEGEARAVVTAAWLKEVAVVVVVLSCFRACVALVLDPSDPRLESAVDQWRAEGALSLGVQDRSVFRVLRVPAHMDGVVGRGLLEVGLMQGSEAYARALKDFTAVERALDSLAVSFRMPWAAGRVVALQLRTNLSKDAKGQPAAAEASGRDS